MFVPSLSWQNDRFYIQMAQKDRFSQANAAVFGAPFLIAAKRSDLLRQARDNARP
jgi:hypothetical protein